MRALFGPVLGGLERVGHDEERQLAREGRALDVRHELGRRHQRLVGQPPAHERLGAARRARAEMDDRLVEDDELLALERGLDIADDAGVHTAPEEDRLVGRVALRGVHLAVGPLQQLLAAVSVVGVHRPADAAVDLDRGAVDVERPPERLPEPPDERGRLVVVGRGEREHDELVAADPGHGVARADDRLEPLRQRAQDRVAGPVAANVVHVLEVVEVDEDERERLAGAAAALQRLIQAILEQDTVREARQRVPDRLRPGATQPPVEGDAARSRAESEQAQGANDAIRVPLERDRRRAGSIHERRQNERPRERAARPSPIPHASPLVLPPPRTQSLDRSRWGPIPRP